MINRTTAIMMAAGHMECDRIYRDIHYREELPFRASTPENGLDIGEIRAAADSTRLTRMYRDAIILTAAGIGFIIGIPALTDENDDGSNQNWLAIVAALLVIAVAQLLFVRTKKRRARQILAKMANDEIAESAPPSAQTQNVVVSGGYSPFVGAGNDQQSWSFVINLTKAADTSSTIGAIDVRTLYSEITKYVEQLGLDRLCTSDMVFIDGRDVSDVRQLMPRGKHCQPEPFLDDITMQSTVDEAKLKIRHYKVLRASLWGGQLVLSVFFRCVKQSNLLFVEARVFTLPPLKEEFLKYERMARVDGLKDMRDDVVFSAFSAPFVWILPALKVVTFVAGGFLEYFRSKDAANAKAIDQDPKFNYGWPKSLREVWSSNNYERYFQRVDKEFYEKSINEALLDSLSSSLETRNISVEAFKEASTRIFNAGIIVSGGTVNAENMAAGRGATAVVSKVLKGANEAASAKRMVA